MSQTFRNLSSRGKENLKREGEDCISETKGQVSCTRGKRETSNSEKQGQRAKVEEQQTEAGTVE